MCIYRQYDGYPSGHGHELAQFLGSKTLVNGFGGVDLGNLGFEAFDFSLKLGSRRFVFVASRTFGFFKHAFLEFRYGAFVFLDHRINMGQA